jgi:1-acyl-sn-glycerol-3-phosphate acyltransferase
MRFGYAFVHYLAQGLLRFLFGMKIRGLENIPRTGKFILASNHRSNFDPPILGSFGPREVHFFAKSELFENRLLGGFIRYLNAFPVHRGQFDRTSLSTCLQILAGEHALVFFPEGTRAPADGFLKAKLGLGWVACLSGAPILPVYIHGSATAKVRFRLRPQISVTIGKPVSVAELGSPEVRGKELYQLVSDRALELIRDLSLQEPLGRVTEKGAIYDRDTIENERLR